MKNNKTNARRRAARRYIKNHNRYIAEWLVEMYDCDVYTISDFNNIFDSTSLDYKKYLALQKSTDSAKDRARLKIWYYADYKIKNIPHKLMVHVIFYIIKRKLTRMPIDTIAPKDYLSKLVPEPKISLHVDSVYLS